MPEHGTVECYDQGCRRPVCVYAQQQRVAAARRAEMESTVQAMMPAPETIPPGDEPGDEDPPSD